MQCPYYSKLPWTKRIRGIMGFCELQKKDIYRKFIMGNVPAAYCEGIKGKSNRKCGIYMHYGRKKVVYDGENHIETDR